ncbi:MAG: hypothetical protein Q7W05_11615 [Deltaproteobacteria bacterium]|nr:hypothetical protein [Deltaproteobacteria bacterium]
MLNRLAAYLGFIRKSAVHEQLQFARSVGKRLDEHREVVEAMEESGFFDGKWWHVGHMATQDDYLMRLYHPPNARGAPSNPNGLRSNL